METEESNELRDDAMKRAFRLARQIADINNGSRPGQQNRSVRKWVEDFVQKPETLADGKALTPLLQLPSDYWPLVAEVVKSSGPYAANPLGLMVTLKNVSPQPLHVTVEMVPIPSFTRGKNAWVEKPGVQERPRTRRVGAGETIELPVRWAITAMLDHSMSGYPPILWGASGAIPQEDKLEEVRYRAVVIGIDSADHQAAEPQKGKRR